MREGFDFSVEYDVTKRTWYGKKVTEHKKESFHVEEPTLGTLDRMSGVMMEMEAYEDFDKEVDFRKATELASKYTRKMCKVISLAVIGSDYVKMVEKKGVKRRIVDETRIEELVEVFMHCMKPSDLKAVTMYVLAFRNLQDFLASTALMSANRTSRPDVVES